MGTTFVIIPKEEEAKNGLLQLVGELEFFFPDQVKVRDALALETGSLAMEAFLDMLAVQVDEKAIARAVEPEDVWAPISETENWQPLNQTDSPVEAPGNGFYCLECGAPLSGMKRKFCSKSCSVKDYKSRHPGKKHRNNGNEGSDGSAAHPEPTGLPIAHTEAEISEFSPSWMNS